MKRRHQSTARLYLLLVCTGGLATAAIVDEASTGKSVPSLLNCSGSGVSDSDWHTVVAAANASSVAWGTDKLTPNSSMGSGSIGDDRVSFTALMQVTDPIGGYAKHFLALARTWATPRRVPLLVYGALPGGNDTHPTPQGRDPRFGKVWLLAQAMREALAKRSDSGAAAKDGEHWLLWLDSDVVLLERATQADSTAQESNFAADLVEAYSRPGADSRCRREASNTGHTSDMGAAEGTKSDNVEEDSSKAADFTGVHAIVADQRDSLLGDVNAGVMLWKVSPWSLAFLEAWWNHPLAVQGAYEQLVFSTLWQSNALHVQSHVALTPSDAINSYPGQWWPAAGTGRRASPVLHLMQRSDTVRTSVGQAAVARVCLQLSLSAPSGSLLKPSLPNREASTSGESVDWVFLASRASLVDAAAALLSDKSLLPPGEAARVLFDLLFLAQSKEWRIAAHSAANADAPEAVTKNSAVDVSVDCSSALTPSFKTERCPKSTVPVPLSLAQTCLLGHDAAAWLAPRALAWFAAHRQLPSRKDTSNEVHANSCSSSKIESTSSNSVVVVSGSSDPSNDAMNQVNGEIVRYEAIFLELLASSAVGRGSTQEEELLRRAASLRELHLPALHRVSDPPAAQSEFAASLGRLAQVIVASPLSGSSPSTAAGARQSEAEDMLRKATRLRLAALASLGAQGGGRSSRHPDSASLQLDLAGLLDGQGGRSMLEGGRLEEALALTRVAANDLEHSLGEQHPWVAASVHRVASLLLQMVGVSHTQPTAFYLLLHFFLFFLQNPCPWYVTDCILVACFLVFPRPNLSHFAFLSLSPILSFLRSKGPPRRCRKRSSPCSPHSPEPRSKRARLRPVVGRQKAQPD